MDAILVGLGFAFVVFILFAVGYALVDWFIFQPFRLFGWGDRDDEEEEWRNEYRARNQDDDDD